MVGLTTPTDVRSTMGWSLEERRGRVVDAAVQLAADRGLEHVTLRAAADVAGMSWDTARESFYDHADLLRAISVEVTARNVPVETVRLDAPGTFAEGALEVTLRFWELLTAHRDLQLVSYEIVVTALRRTALRPLVVGQLADQRALAEHVLTEFAEQNGVTWDRPVADVARFVATFLDGLTTAWLVDADEQAAAEQLTLLVQVLSTFVAER